MSPQRYQSARLDEDTLAYLRAVRQSDGRGAPGVYLDGRAAHVGPGVWPGLGAFVGFFLVGLGVLLAYALLWHAPLNVGLLLASFLFLGVWLVASWVRCLLARGRASFVGHFKYVDPLHLYECAGTEVFVTPLARAQEARFRHDHARGHSMVKIVLEHGFVEVRVGREDLAEALQAFVNEVVADRAGTPADRGYAAADKARVERCYRRGEPAPPVQKLPTPDASRAGGPGVLRYVGVAAFFFATLAVSYFACRAWRDASIYSAVKDRNPPELRVYLIDSRNAIYRADVLARLKRHHDQLADGVERQNGEPALKKAVADLIRSTSASATPEVTMAFERAKDADDAGSMEAVLGKGEAAALRAGRLKQLGEVELPGLFRAVGGLGGNGVALGDQVVAFVEAKPGEFANVLVTARLERPEGKDGRYRVVWSVKLRRAADDEGVTVRWQQGGAMNDPRSAENEFRRQCEQFPQTFKQFLQTPIQPGMRL